MRLPETCHTGLLYIPAPRRTSSGDVVGLEISHDFFVHRYYMSGTDFFFCHRCLQVEVDGTIGTHMREIKSHERL